MTCNKTKHKDMLKKKPKVKKVKVKGKGGTKAKRQLKRMMKQPAAKNKKAVKKGY